MSWCRWLLRTALFVWTVACLAPVLLDARGQRLLLLVAALLSTAGLYISGEAPR